MPIESINAFTPVAVYRQLLDEDPARREYSYLFETPLNNRSLIGYDPERVVTYDHTKGFEEIINGKKRTIGLPTDNPVSLLNQYVDLDQPHFYLISPDIVRKEQDATLPLILFIQPGKEIHFKNDAITLNTSELDNTRIREMAYSGRTAVASEVKQTLSPSTDWKTETDDYFIKRLSTAIRQLAPHHGMKMIVMREYKKLINENLDILDLYDIYSQLEPDAGAGHIVYLPDATTSLGRSPENVFEIEGKTLRFDVMASTRGISTNADKDRKFLAELQTDPKEKLEHELAIKRTSKGMMANCREGSLIIDQHMAVKTFRHVRHLHSRLHASLQAARSYIDVINSTYPPLQSYTRELINMSDTNREPLRFYGGMLGYMNQSRSEANCFLNIRTLIRRQNCLHTHGGVGVMKESIAEHECKEVKNKLSCLMEAVSKWEDTRQNE